MADLVHIRVVFKAGPGQQNNLEADYEISPDELEKLVADFQRINNPTGAYRVRRRLGNTMNRIDTMLVLKFSDVLYIG